MCDRLQERWNTGHGTAKPDFRLTRRSHDAVTMMTQTCDFVHAQAAGRMLDAEDLPILGMLVERTAPRDIAAVLRCSAEELQRRLTRMLSAMCIPRGPRTA